MPPRAGPPSPHHANDRARDGEQRVRVDLAAAYRLAHHLRASRRR